MFYSGTNIPKFGPIYQSASREIYPHEENETCSESDRIFQDEPPTYNAAPRAPHAPAVGYIHGNSCHLSTGLSSTELVEKYDPMIQDHIERKVQFAFYQMIACYKTHLAFETVGSLDQGTSAKKFTLIVPNSLPEKIERHAAHSSSNPCLVAYDRREWDQYQIDKMQNSRLQKPRGFVFLKGTDYYRTMNATMGMIRAINNADQKLEEKGGPNSLRKEGNRLINEISKGSLTPDQGISIYIQKAIEQTQRAIQEGEPEKVSCVLALYNRYFSEIQRKAARDPLFIEKLLGLKHPSNSLIRNIRYKAIRDCQFHQFTLMEKISEVCTLIRGAFSRKPPFFNEALKDLIIKQADIFGDGKRLKKLLNFSDLSSRLDPAKREQYTFTRNSIYEHVRNKFIDNRHIRKNLLCSPLNQIHILMIMQRTKEVRERATTVKILREMKNWNHEQLDAEIRRAFPNSQYTSQLLESHQQVITEKIAKELSQIFGVDECLFTPHFFYE